MTLDLDPADYERDARWNRLSLIAMAAGGGFLLTAAVLFALFFSGVLGSDAKYEGPGDAPTSFGNIYAPSTPQPTPTAPNDAPITRILIPRFEVDAPIVIRGLDENRIMESPDGPWDVAWYDFTARPGFGSNAVFSGHVDWYNVGPGGGAGEAVFWHLKDLEQGDLVEVRLEDGTVYRYRVTAKQQVPGTADFNEIVGPTETEVLTLITCGGSFNTATRHYDQRVVVRAERISGAPGQLPPGASALP